MSLITCFYDNKKVFSKHCSKEELADIMDYLKLHKVPFTFGRERAAFSMVYVFFNDVSEVVEFKVKWM